MRMSYSREVEHIRDGEGRVIATRTGAWYDHEAKTWIDGEGNPVETEPAGDLYYSEES